MDVRAPAEILAKWEAVGGQFSPLTLQRARDLTVEAVARVGAAIRSGMTEAQAHDLAIQILTEMKMDRLWHKPVIRFGAGTLKTFAPPMDAERQLRQRDIYYVDLGVVWDGHEGDAGDTFVVGGDSEMWLCAEAAREIWKEVSAVWARDRLTGPALYEIAVEAAGLAAGA